MKPEKQPKYHVSGWTSALMLILQPFGEKINQMKLESWTLITNAETSTLYAQEWPAISVLLCPLVFLS